MKACGISLYRIAAPLFSAVAGIQRCALRPRAAVMARANERAEPLDSQIRGRRRARNALLSRRWVVGRDGAIYHYAQFDQQQNVFTNLEIYTLEKDAWRLERPDVRDPRRVRRPGVAGRRGLGAGVRRQGEMDRVPARPLRSNHRLLRDDAAAP
jgi:hypothetical protein